MQQLDQLKVFSFPYDTHRFSGQANDERILYITREHQLFLWLRFVSIILIAIAIFLAAWVFAWAFENIFSVSSLSFVVPLTLVLLGAFSIVGWWWVHTLWRRSLAFITNKRLIKIVYTTPFNRYHQSLPLDMVVDTSCNNQGFFEGIGHSVLQVGTLTARSSAASSGVATEDIDRVNKKYFYLENIQYCEDLQQYLNKILHMLRHNPAQLDGFRPFIPHLKGQQREQFIEQHAQNQEPEK